MVSGKCGILQQLTRFLHAGVQLIILIVFVELPKGFGEGAVDDTVIRHFGGFCGAIVCRSLGDIMGRGITIYTYYTSLLAKLL
jgi:hypothetical protein